MEDWLAQLEMDIEPVSTVTDTLYDQSETMEACLEQIATSLSEDLHYPLSADDGDRNSPQWEAFDYTDVIEQFISKPNLLNESEIHSVINSGNDSNNNVTSNNNVKGIISKQMLDSKEENKKKKMSGGTKRKRQPKQVQEHIIAERKRRELLSQLFISLSAIVPDLKKMDKTSILGAAIKYMKQLQEEVKELKEVAARRTMESIVVVKKSEFIVDDDNDGGDGGDNNSSSTTVDDYLNKHSVPEIEVKISKKTLLLRVYCEEQGDNLEKLFAELNKHALRITTCSAIPFENLALNITIVAKVKRGFNDNIKAFIRSLHSALSSS